ncbi:MAG: MFS transporter [Bryobacteraceae bacterium]
MLCFAANLIAHSDRVSISVALPAMMRERGWDTADAGWVLSGFFLGYTLLMIPVGLVTQRIGTRPVFAACMSWWSLFTLLTPLPRSLGGLAAMRVMLGVGESGTASCINGTLVRWFPPGEYSRAASICWSAGYAGPIIAVPAATWLLHRFGWQAIFAVFGIAGFLWLPFWLRVEDKGSADAASTRAPWAALLASRAVWALFALHFSSNWFLYVMISWLPTYLVNERHLSLPAMAAGSSLPFACAWIGANGFAQWLDHASARMSRTRARKLLLIPYAIAAVCVFAAPTAPSPAVTVALLCLAMGFLGAATPVFAAGSLDLAPRFAGALAAAQNAFANLAGIIAPALVGYLVRGAGWNAAFALTAGVAACGIVAYAAFGNGEEIALTPSPEP